MFSLEITLQERKSLDHLLSVMAKFSIDSKEYNLARKSFAWICNKIRIKEKTDQENLC